MNKKEWKEYLYKIEQLYLQTIRSDLRPYYEGLKFSEVGLEAVFFIHNHCGYELKSLPISEELLKRIFEK